MPTQTTPSTGEVTEAAIVFDGKTFTVTFTQTAGKNNHWPIALCVQCLYKTHNSPMLYSIEISCLERVRSEWVGGIVAI